jgi:hypothetical protein
MDQAETLNALLSKAASEWTPEDRLALVAALREQRERWNAEQSAGTRKRVSSKKVVAKKASLDLAFEGLKL